MDCPDCAGQPASESAQIREQFAGLGREFVVNAAARSSGNALREKALNPGQTMNGILRTHSPSALAEAVGESIRQGTQEERIGGFYVYHSLVYEDKVPVDKEHLPLLIKLLDQDDLAATQYTVALTTVLTLYPARETVLAFMRAAQRAPDARTKHAMEVSASQMLGMYRPTMSMDDFEAWFTKNVDRIQFNQKGEFRLARCGAQADQKELRQADRDQIRKDPVCVVRLLNDGLSGEGSLASLRTMMDWCGAALVGTEGAETIAESLQASQDGKGSSVEIQASLAALRGKYPMGEAYLLAAIYILAYETNPEDAELAKNALFRATPAEIRRVAKGEPRWVRKKALEYANPDED